jgi:hypothetical protein
MTQSFRTFCIHTKHNSNQNKEANNYDTQKNDSHSIGLGLGHEEMTLTLMTTQHNHTKHNDTKY